MIKQGMITLIAEEPKARGVFDTPVETSRRVPCEVHSINLTLAAEAKALGLAPTLRVRLRHESTYNGEKLAAYQDVRYKIVNARPLEKSSGIDLLLERLEGNADV